MKFATSLDLAIPRQRAIELLSDPQYLPMWLRGVVLHEPIDGKHGQAGTHSRVVMQQGKHQMEIFETVTRLEPDDPAAATADQTVVFEREIVGQGMWSRATDLLTVTGPESTHWVSQNEYRFNGTFMRLMMSLMRGSFRRQGLQHMRDFQAFAERGEDVRASSK